MAVGARIRLKITHKGRTLGSFRRIIRSIRPKLLLKIGMIGYRIADHMSLVINRDRVRKGATSSGGLASAFKDRSAVESSLIGDMIHIGIGNKQVLNATYPYWKVVNKGGFTPSPTFGFFGHGDRPNSAYAGTGVGKQLWHRPYDPGGPHIFYMVPKNPIPAMNYIGKTSAWTRIQWNTKWKQEILRDIRRNR